MATIAIHQLSLADWRAAALTCVPIVGFGLVPTLACAAGIEAPPPWPQLPIGHAKLLEHFTMTSGQNVTDGLSRPWRLLTSALCHADAEHRDRNALALIASGWGPARALGGLGFWLAFFGGHAIAVLNRSGHLLQLRRHIDATTYGYLPTWATPTAARLWQKAAPARVLGGSAGIFGLLGVDMCLKAEAALELWRQWRREAAQRHDQPLDDIDDFVNEIVHNPSLVSLIVLAVNTYSIVRLVWAEHASLAAGASVHVGHAAHLTGFAWGVAVYGARLAWRRWGGRRGWRSWDGSGTARSGRGRRLGGGDSGGRRLGGGGGRPRQ